MQYNEKLDAALAALKGDMVETLQRWVRVPSVRAERSAENAPFGADVRRALDTAMADLKRLGFEPRDVDGYCCDTEIGSGDDVVAVLAHLDVVPEGDGWTHDPYGAEIIDGRMIGRGTSDDKGPGVAALFGMKASPPLPPDSGLRRGMRHGGFEVLREESWSAGYGLLSGREFPAHQYRKGHHAAHSPCADGR